jgi:hypothetical protein
MLEEHMTLVQHGGDGPVFQGTHATREQATATGRPQEKLVDVIVDDAWDAGRLARRLRDEWRRERYARLKHD